MVVSPPTPPPSPLDPEQPFLRRGGEGAGSDLETILITRLSTHVTVPCLVTVPDLNVTLHTVGGSSVDS